MDYSGGLWVTAFNEVAEQIMGMSANDLVELRDTNEAAFERAFIKGAATEWSFQMMAKQDTFNVGALSCSTQY